MKQVIFILFVLHLFLQDLPAQDNFTRNPDSALFVTSDIKNFWKAYDLFMEDSTVNPFGKYYIEPGSEVAKGFLPYRIVDAENLVTVMKKRKADI